MHITVNTSDWSQAFDNHCPFNRINLMSLRGHEFHAKKVKDDGWQYQQLNLW